MARICMVSPQCVRAAFLAAVPRVAGPSCETRASRQRTVARSSAASRGFRLSRKSRSRTDAWPSRSSASSVARRSSAKLSRTSSALGTRRSSRWAFSRVARRCRQAGAPVNRLQRAWPSRARSRWRLLGAPSSVLAFADVVDLFAYEFTCLRKRSCPPACPSRHAVVSSSLAFSFPLSVELKFGLGALEHTLTCRAQVPAATVDVKGEHRHRRPVRFRLAPLAAFSRAHQRERYPVITLLESPCFSNPACVARFRDALRPASSSLFIRTFARDRHGSRALLEKRCVLVPAVSISLTHSWRRLE